MTWSHTKLKVQTEMLPALAQACEKCPYVQHMLVLVRLGRSLPEMMWMTHSNLRSGVEALAQYCPSLWLYIPTLETQDSITCAALIKASELRRDAGRLYRAWRERQVTPLRVMCESLTPERDAKIPVWIERVRGGDIELVPLAPEVPHPPYRERF